MSTLLSKPVSDWSDEDWNQYELLTKTPVHSEYLRQVESANAKWWQLEARVAETWEALIVALAAHDDRLLDEAEDFDLDLGWAFDRGLLRLGRDITDEYYTELTDTGKDLIRAALRLSEHPGPLAASTEPARAEQENDNTTP